MSVAFRGKLLLVLLLMIMMLMMMIMTITTTAMIMIMTLILIYKAHRIISQEITLRHLRNSTICNLLELHNIHSEVLDTITRMSVTTRRYPEWKTARKFGSVYVLGN